MQSLLVITFTINLVFAFGAETDQGPPAPIEQQTPELPSFEDDEAAERVLESTEDEVEALKAQLKALEEHQDTETEETEKTEAPSVETEERVAVEYDESLYTAQREGHDGTHNVKDILGANGQGQEPEHDGAMVKVKDALEDHHDENGWALTFYKEAEELAHNYLWDEQIANNKKQQDEIDDLQQQVAILQGTGGVSGEDGEDGEGGVGFAQMIKKQLLDIFHNCFGGDKEHSKEGARVRKPSGDSNESGSGKIGKIKYMTLRRL